MSSFIGHGLIGYAIGVRTKHSTIHQSISVALFFAALAISPDLDYLLLWFTGYHIEPRYSHSVGFCVFIACCGLLLKKGLLKSLLQDVPSMLLFIAPLSHLVLDYLVGVYSSPMLWPLSDNLFAFTYGVLPSAGRIDLSNIYFWRNLLIELGILIPVAIVIVPEYRVFVHSKKILLVSLIVLFVVSFIIGLNLQR